MFNPQLKAASRMRWTKSSIDCYLLGCQCQKCEVYKIIGNRCRMKYAVLELVRRYGIPKKEVNEDETAYESEETGKTKSQCYQGKNK